MKRPFKSECYDVLQKLFLWFMALPVCIRHFDCVNIGWLYKFVQVYCMKRRSYTLVRLNFGRTERRHIVWHIVSKCVLHSLTNCLAPKALEKLLTKANASMEAMRQKKAGDAGDIGEKRTRKKSSRCQNGWTHLHM